MFLRTIKAEHGLNMCPACIIDNYNINKISEKILQN